MHENINIDKNRAQEAQRAADEPKAQQVHVAEELQQTKMRIDEEKSRRERHAHDAQNAIIQLRQELTRQQVNVQGADMKGVQGMQIEIKYAK